MNIKIISIEAYWLIKIIKYYYNILQQIYFIIYKELLDLVNTRILQIAIKAINNTINLNNLIFILFIFSVYLYLINYNFLVLLVTKHAIVLRKAITKIY